MKDCKSNSMKSSFGIPQGSVVVPLLNMLYVKDYCSTDAILHVDDASSLIKVAKQHLWKLKLAKYFKVLMYR